MLLMPARLDNQVVGNVGLFYVCYQLSRLGWNCMPTARNARGIDVVIYSQDTRRKHTVQVKALSKRSPVPLGKHLDHLFADFIIVCSGVVVGEKPECFIFTPNEVKSLAHHGSREGRTSIWLQPKNYRTKAFEEAWHRIGDGTLVVADVGPLISHAPE